MIFFSDALMLLYVRLTCALGACDAAKRTVRRQHDIRRVLCVCDAAKPRSRVSVHADVCDPTGALSGYAHLASMHRWSMHPAESGTVITSEAVMRTAGYFFSLLLCSLLCRMRHCVALGSRPLLCTWAAVGCNCAHGRLPAASRRCARGHGEGQ